ncbi:MAG: tetratricopeptide repeat protein [Deltaproteobacteria bacterium]|nr:tetratricopeptide repeat protein [Deltaproteobacteria bacterium]MBW2135692.1 tetratricopeptide repeat protein [Deltaproteobacteria bacterium]
MDKSSRVPPETMLRVIIVFLMFSPLSPLTINCARADNIAGPSIVTVVSLDSQGQPLRQGLGVIIDPRGLILTSLEIFLNSQGGMIKTAKGALHLIEGVVQLDRLQDWVLLKVNAEGLVASSVSKYKAIKPSERVMLPARERSQITFKEVAIKGIYPISPRLALLDLRLSKSDVASGTPLFSQAGEVMGIAHRLNSPPERGKSSLYFLPLNRSQLPPVKKNPEALKSFEEVADLARTKSPEGLFWQGMAAMVRQNWVDAVEKFNEAIKIDKKFPEAYYGRAQARFFQKDYEGAEKDLNKAIKLLPSYARASFWLGKTRQKLGDKAGEILAYERAVKINPHLSEAYFKLGQLAYKTKDFDRARQCFRQAGEGFPEAAQSWWYLGTIARIQGESAEAVENFKKAIALNPQFFEAYLSLGKLLLTVGAQPQEAVEILTEAVQQRPRHGEARLYLALAQWLSWNRGGALEQYFALQDLNPRLAARLHQTLNYSR